MPRGSSLVARTTQAPRPQASTPGPRQYPGGTRQAPASLDSIPPDPEPRASSPPALGPRGPSPGLSRGSTPPRRHRDSSPEPRSPTRPDPFTPAPGPLPGPTPTCPSPGASPEPGMGCMDRGTLGPSHPPPARGTSLGSQAGPSLPCPRGPGGRPEEADSPPPPEEAASLPPPDPSGGPWGPMGARPLQATCW